MHPLKTRPRTHGNASRLAVLLAWGVLGMAPLAAQQKDLQDAELAKRQALVQEARELVDEGDKSMREGRPDLAVKAYAGARERIPNAPALKEILDAVTERYVAASLKHAAILANRGDMVAARTAVDKVLDPNVAPKHPSALKMKEMLNDPIRINPAITPDHVKDVDKVNELILMANSAIALGRFDMAAEKFEGILRIDPHNVLARRGLVQVISMKEQSRIAAFDQTRAEMLLQVEKEWELPVRPADTSAELPDFADLGEQNPGATIEAKLRNIIIPQLALDDVNLFDAVEFLRVASIREDVNAVAENQRGVNFTVNLGPDESPVVQAIRNKRFDLRLQNVPLIEALRYVTELTSTAYSTDAFAVKIIPLNQVSEEVFMRTYTVPPDFISALSEDSGVTVEQDPFSDAQPGGGLLTERLPVQELLKRKGVAFGEGASASYSAATNQLVVVNTSKAQAIIEQLIEIIKGADPTIVAVQVTMIQAQQKDLEELGFDWLLNPVTLGGDSVLGGGTPGNTLGRTVGDFAGTLPLLGGPDATAPNVITNGLRSGDRTYVADNLDAIINNPDRATQTSRVAPGILALTGIFNDGQAQVMMRGLSQKEGVDMMARPSVVARSGEEAEIVLAREFIYPTEYDPPELQQGGNNNNQFNNGQGGGNQGPAFPVVPANPTSFEMREVGISLNVVAVAAEDKNYISVNLSPEIVEFDGFVNYGSPITVPVPDALGGISRVTLTRNEILMPVFNTKRATTQLTVADGATVAFGGLLSQNIQLVEDKVPVLGDIPVLGSMFRSKSHLPVSTAIIFMVKVDLMDPTGRPYREIRNP